MANFCRHCGAKAARPNAAFCATCGQPLAASPSSSSPTHRVSVADASSSHTGTVFLGNLTHLGQLPSFTIGRDRTSSLPLDHPTVSRNHARVDRVTSGHAIRDLGSSNGTYVNGQAVKGQVALQAGDVIQVGPFKVVYNQGGFSQYSPEGNYRLDAIGLRRTINVGKFFSLDRWRPSRAATTKKLILNDVSLSIYPREFVALVGGSGAGKSTLMNALSGFVPAQGQVLINGDDLYANFATYRSILGYVPQQDIIHGQLTVRSALHYAARLRLPDLDSKEIEQRVDAVIQQVELAGVAGSQISRLSGGQRKRVSIGVELLAEPGVFFLDEPTSGLDPGLEHKMMHTLRRLADGGRTILLVTHATANINLCTHVAFVAEGRLAYFGPPNEAMSFFHSRDFAEIYNRLSQPLDSKENPIPPAWQGYYRQLCTSKNGQPPTPGEFWAYCFRSSPQYQRYVAGRGQAQATPTPASRPVQSQRARAASIQQFWTLTRRYFNLLTRDWMSLFTLLAIMPLIGLLLLMMVKPYDLIGKEPVVVQQEIQQEIRDLQADPPSAGMEQFQSTYVTAGAAQRLLFMLALAAGLLGVFAAAYEIVGEDAIYRRERMVNLQIGPYLFSKMAVLGTFALIQSLLLLAVMSLRITFPEEGIFMPAPVEMYITLLLATITGVAFGLFISAAVQSRGSVIYLILLVIFFQIIFAGAIFDLPPTARPLSYMTPTRWALEALGSTVDLPALRDQGVSCIEFADEGMGRLFHDAQDPCEEGQMRQSVDFKFNVDYEHSSTHLQIRWLILLGFTVGFGLLTYWLQRSKDIAGIR